MSIDREGKSAVIRTTLLCAAGVTLAVGGYLLGLRSAEAGTTHTDETVPPSHVERSADELEAKLANLSAQARALSGDFSSLTAGISTDDSSDDSLDDLIASYGELAPGEERDNLLRRILLKTQLQVGDSGDLKDLEFFRTLLKNPQSTRRERHAAMVVAHPLARRTVPGVLGYLEEGLNTTNSTVRAFAAEGLAWINGPEQQRAHERLRGLLRDADPFVRQMVAGCLAAIVREPRDADLLERALQVETEEVVATEILDAIRTLDPVGYRQRLEVASKHAKPAIRPLIEERLAAVGGAATDK